ncbi:ATP synthase mitochondrial F1 complex assembly factor 2 isoform X2 [Phalaenopsis equestris]|uniref:ATP synthase mitochondrial F1 complex assembly factor 2 isoform X2 n=1 Tax=Phalaenopsis equestris TaxID=78828 RepID=UPI0009E4147D|nr:ATP synthase mitochondrial F1 complex assembly factor 2 isoform X2 [Phalaenopsis equestris]
MGSPANQITNLVSLRRSLLYSAVRRLSSNAVPASSEFSSPPSFAPPADTTEKDDMIYLKRPNSSSSSHSVTRDEVSVTMPMTFMTGSVVGKRFYKEVTTRMADDGNGWTVMLDYRTLKTPSKRPLKLPNLALAKAIAAEWEYQQTDGIRPFTMPLMKLACTALERVPLTRAQIIQNLIDKFHQDLVFCRSPGDTDLTKGLREKQEEKIDPLIEWLQSEFHFKPKLHSSLFGGKQDEIFVNAVENVLKKTTDSELATIDAIASSAHSLVIALAIFRERLDIEEAMELIRLEEDLQVDKWGLVEGGHDVDIADLQASLPMH